MLIIGDHHTCYLSTLHSMFKGDTEFTDCIFGLRDITADLPKLHYTDAVGLTSELYPFVQNKRICLPVHGFIMAPLKYNAKYSTRQYHLLDYKSRKTISTLLDTFYDKTRPVLNYYHKLFSILGGKLHIGGVDWFKISEFSLAKLPDGITPMQAKELELLHKDASEAILKHRLFHGS